MTSHIRKFGAVGASTTLLGGAGSALLLALAASPAGAVPATFTVDTLDDGAATASDCTTPVVGSCSLRDALAAASTGDIVSFATSLFTGGPGTITMDSGEGQFASDGVNVQGPGSSLLTVRATGSNRVFYLRTEVSGTTISGMTITGGDVDGKGGGLYDENSNYLILNEVVITGNTSSESGGGVAGGQIKLVNSVVSGNRVTGTSSGGGGIYADNDVYILDSTIDGNSAGNCGGGLYFGADTSMLAVFASTFSNNTAEACYGGAIDVDGEDNVVLIGNSTFTGNSATAGGAISLAPGNGMQVGMTTITGNTATATGDVYYSGGGIHMSIYTTGLYLVGSIVAGNTGVTADIAVGSGAGSGSVGGPTSAGSSTSKGPKGPKGGGPTPPQVGALRSMLGSGSAISSNVTLQEDPGLPNVRGNDPMLGALADNGGPTKTMQQVTGSPVIDAGPTAAGIPDFPGNEFDQRGPGFPRIIGPRADIGAVEGVAPEPEPVVPAFTG